MLKRKLIGLFVAATLAGCAAHPDPIVDTKGVDPEKFAQDWDECEKYLSLIHISEPTRLRLKSRMPSYA